MEASVKARRCANVSAPNEPPCVCADPHNLDGSFLGFEEVLVLRSFSVCFFDQAVHKFASRFACTAAHAPAPADAVVFVANVRRVLPKSLFVADDLPF